MLMVLSAQQKQQAAQLFALKWRGYHAPKKQATQAFWQDLLHDVYGEPHPEKLIAFIFSKRIGGKKSFKQLKYQIFKAKSMVVALLPKTRHSAYNKNPALW